MVLAITFSALAVGQQRDEKAWSGTLEDNQDKPVAGAVVKLESRGCAPADSYREGRPILIP